MEQSKNRYKNDNNQDFKNTHKYDDSHKYDDIIHLPHHVSGVYPQMSLQNRAAQFSPFAALTGYEEQVREAARLSAEKITI